MLSGVGQPVYQQPNFQPKEASEELAVACKKEQWELAFEIFKANQKTCQFSESDLLNAIDELSEDQSVELLELSREKRAISPTTDSFILLTASNRGFTKLAKNVIEFGSTQPGFGDQSLKISVKSNHKALAELLLISDFCTEMGKNKAALHAVRLMKTEILQLLFSHSAVSGIYKHPSNIYLGETMVPPYTESTWTLLLREAIEIDFWEGARLIANHHPGEFTSEEEGYLVLLSYQEGNCEAGINALPSQSLSPFVLEKLCNLAEKKEDFSLLRLGLNQLSLSDEYPCQSKEQIESLWQDCPAAIFHKD